MKRKDQITFLYVITRKVTGQRYVGVSMKPKVRWWTHQWFAGRSRQFVHKAIAKHGADEFTFEVVACSRTWPEAAETERQLIEQYRSHVSDGGYNLTRGGEGPLGRECSPETRERIGRSRRGKPGRPIPSQEREIHRVNATRMYAEHPEYRAKLAQLALESRIRNGNTGVGRKNSPETIERMREAARNRWASATAEQRRAHAESVSRSRSNPLRVPQHH